MEINDLLNALAEVWQGGHPIWRKKHIQLKLDDCDAPDDNTDLDVSTSAHGLAPKAPNDTTKFLRGDASWEVPTGVTPAAHHTTHESGGSDAIKLDDLASPDDNTDLNATASAHGLLPKLSGSATQVLAGDGTWVSLPTSSVVDITATAGEALSARDCCYIELNGAGGTAGRAYKTDADTKAKSSEAWVVGFATAAASAGASVTLRIAGIMTGFTGLTAGAVQYASATAGAITATPPTNKWMVGVALSATTVLVNTRGAQDSVVPTYGYFAGGYTTTNVATADRLTFATSTTAAQTSANLSVARQILAGCSDGSTYGYFAGGYTSSNFATADRLTFATSTTAAQTSANLSVARRSLPGCSDGSTYGYFAGGYTTTHVVTADRLTFSTSTTAAQTSANLSVARADLASCSDGSTYGYFAGGDTGSVVATADRLTFATSTTAAQTSANLSVARRSLPGCSDGSTYGYFAGGDTGDTGVNVVTADRLTFSTSTTAAQSSANLSVARTKLAACSDGGMYGYFAGGYTTAVVATADRLTFSTSTTAACTTANLSQARKGLASLADLAI